MPLAPATRLGPYEVTQQIGVGGMGEVYLARDPKLNRAIAIKILPEAAAADPERRVRFEREAQSIAALSHPNIVTIYSVEEAHGVLFLTMELVEGKPMSELIVKGGLPLTQFLALAIPLADAISAAHHKGIAHRDLKPANVMVTPEGRVKVLDFGLARLIEPAHADVDLTGLPTGGLTGDGRIVGTVAYMSPEQAEGRAVDARSDIFSFGVILYEMATGRRPFDGNSQAAVIAAVLKEDPRPIAEVRPDFPQDVVRLIDRCLKKDPTRRAQSMADLRVALTEVKEAADSGRLGAAAPTAAPVPTKRSLAMTIAGGAMLLLVGILVGWRVGAGTTSHVDLSPDPVPLTAYTGDEAMPTWSPDGNQIAFVWNGERQDNRDIYVQVIGSNAPLRLTDDALDDLGPQWSPDGRYIAFVRWTHPDSVDVFLVSPLGGRERRIGQFFTRQLFSQPLADLCWSQDSRFLFVSGSLTKGQAHGIYRLAVDTADVTPVATIDNQTDSYLAPALSPDGRTLAMLHLSGGSIALLSLSANGEAGNERTLDETHSNFVRIAWTANGKDLIAEHGGNTLAPLYRVPVGGGPGEPLTWSGAGAGYAAISPARHRLAFVRQVRDTNIWQVSLNGAAPGTAGVQKLASSSFREVFPQYSPDGQRLAFHSNRGGSVQVWTADADGSRAVQVTTMEVTATTGSPRWSPDGQWIAFDSNAGGNTHVYVIRADGGRPRALTSGSSQNYIATWSRDGRWIYFTSNRSGERQVWRAPSAGGEPEQVTHHGGEAPTVSPDGEWLYFTKGDGLDGLWKMPIAGTSETRVVESVYRYNYAVGSAGVYWMPQRAADLTSAIRFLDAKTGAVTEILKVTKPVDLGLALSPDGRHLLFTQIDYSGQDLMLVEDFR